MLIILVPVRILDRLRYVDQVVVRVQTSMFPAGSCIQKSGGRNSDVLPAKHLPRKRVLQLAVISALATCILPLDLEIVSGPITARPR